MASFPGALASFAGFTSSHTLAADNHAAQHNLEQGEILAVQTKVGTGSFTPIANTFLGGTGAGTSSWRQVTLTSDVTGVLPVANGGTNASSATDARTSLGLNTALETLALAYPVGSIYINASNSTNPGTLLGFGTWTAFGAGRVMVGLNSADTDFDTSEETGGAKTHTLTSAEMPAHTHTINTWTAGAGGGGEALSSNNTAASSAPSTSSTGGGGAHNNLQPYIVVYMWKRTA